MRRRAVSSGRTGAGETRCAARAGATARSTTCDSSRPKTPAIWSTSGSYQQQVFCRSPGSRRRRRPDAAPASSVRHFANDGQRLRRAGSIKPQVLTTTSAPSASGVSAYPSWASLPSIRSESTVFFGQPREINANEPFAAVVMGKPRASLRGEPNPIIISKWSCPVAGIVPASPSSAEGRNSNHGFGAPLRRFRWD